MNQTRKKFITIDEPFTCKKCGGKVEPLGNTCRNHCPNCLYSLHVDEKIPGDRKSTCQGLMKPTHLEKGSRKGYLGFDVVHECEKCGKVMKNRLAEDDDWSILTA